MLTIAGSRGAYSELKQAALGGPLPWPDGHFRAFFSTGVFTISHAPASGLHELARITREGGHAIFTVRDQVLDSGGFRGGLRRTGAAEEMAAGRGKPVVQGLRHRRPRRAGEGVRVRDRVTASELRNSRGARALVQRAVEGSHGTARRRIRPSDLYVVSGHRRAAAARGACSAPLSASSASGATARPGCGRMCWSASPPHLRHPDDRDRACPDIRRDVAKVMQVDPIRVVEAVTAGVAFLAAGTILFSRGEVHGLTTGAGMWLAGRDRARLRPRALADRPLRDAVGADRARPALARWITTARQARKRRDGTTLD